MAQGKVEQLKPLPMRPLLFESRHCRCIDVCRGQAEKTAQASGITSGWPLYSSILLRVVSDALTTPATLPKLPVASAAIRVKRSVGRVLWQTMPATRRARTANALPPYLKHRPKPPQWLDDQAGPKGCPGWLAEKANDFDNIPTFHQKLSAIISYCMGAKWERNLDMVEVCSGFGETSYHVRNNGGTAQEYAAATRHIDEDIYTTKGLLLLFYHLSRIRPGGAAMMSPACSSWGFLCFFITGRHITVHGHLEKIDVEVANYICEVLSTAMVFLYMRKVGYILEQPGRSKYLDHPSCVAAAKTTLAKCYETYLKPFGHPMEKSTALLSNLGDERMLPLLKQRPPWTARTTEDEKFWGVKGANQWTTAGPDLSKSEHYPTEFAKTLATALSGQRER